MENKNLIICLRGAPLFYSGAADWTSHISKAKRFNSREAIAQVSTLRNVFGIPPKSITINLFQKYEERTGG